MLIHDDFCTFPIFSKFKNLTCIFTTKKLGNFDIGKVPLVIAEEFISKIGIKDSSPVAMEQIHGDKIVEVNGEDKDTVQTGVDGLMTHESSLFLCVKTADCVPIFFYDDVKKIVGIAHAGWRGTLKNISGKMVQRFKELGSNTKDIYVAIGPHIGGCCYNVPKERADEFDYIFHDERIVYKGEDQWFLDIGQANRRQLLEVGIKNNRLEALPSCTSCQNDSYFSYRKDLPEKHGEMLGIIGMR